MNIQQDNLYINQVKTKNTYQLTLDNDYIISDKKPDISKIVRSQGEVLIDECKVNIDKVEIKGRVRVVILYLSNDETTSISSVIEHIPYYENMNMPGVVPTDIVSVKGSLEDLNVSIINSRKISIKAIVNIDSTVDKEISCVVVRDIEDTSIPVMKKLCKFSRLTVSKKDIYRLKDEIVLQSSKKNISEILYYDVHMLRCGTRLVDEKLMLKGDIVAFILYHTEDGEYECLEKEITYSGELEVAEIREDMLDDIAVTMTDKDITVKADEDGEMRVIDIDITLGLDINCYKDEEVELVKDAYAIEGELTVEEKKLNYETLLLKNNTVFKVEERIQLEEQEHDILQICNSIATIKIDDISIEENSLKVEGIVEVSIMYVSSKDTSPIDALMYEIPYVHYIEAEGIQKDDVYTLKPCIESVSTAMVTGDTLEVKVSISMDTIVYSSCEENVVVDIMVQPYDACEREKMPSMIGYVVKDGEDWWSVAKKHHVTVDMLKKSNAVVDKELMIGDKLLIKRCNVIEV